jgi:hypothetical protein
MASGDVLYSTQFTPSQITQTKQSSQDSANCVQQVILSAAGSGTPAPDVEGATVVLSANTLQVTATGVSWVMSMDKSYTVTITEN